MMRARLARWQRAVGVNFPGTGRAAFIWNWVQACSRTVSTRARASDESGPTNNMALPCPCPCRVPSSHPSVSRACCVGHVGRAVVTTWAPALVAAARSHIGAIDEGHRDRTSGDGLGGGVIVPQRQVALVVLASRMAAIGICTGFGMPALAGSQTSRGRATSPPRRRGSVAPECASSMSGMPLRRLITRRGGCA